MSTTEKASVENMDTIDQLTILVDFLRLLGKIWVWILIIAIVGGATANIKARMDYVPVYTASTTFTINIKEEQSIYGSSTYYDNAAAQQMAQTFPYILTSAYLYRMVADDMGTPVTSSIGASVVENTNLLTLSVTDRDPQKAYDTLTSVIKCYPSVSEPIVGKVHMNVLDETGVPTEPDNPAVFVKETFTGVGIGLLVCLVWAVLLFITNRTVQKKSDVKNKLGINCLGVVPRIHVKKRSKEVSQYFLLTDPKMEEFLPEPFRMIKNRVEYNAQKHNYKTLLITSATAGEGKSLFAANLSLSLASSGRKVVLIDCDLRHPTGRIVFDMTQNDGLSEYIQGKMEIAEYWEKAKAENNHGVEELLFLPGGEAMDDGSNLLSGERIKNLISYAESEADYVILDSAPVGLLTDSAVLAKYADAAIMVIRNDFARINFINDALSHLAESDIQIAGGVLNDV